jgi:predicted NBD/HSP70 family sugar kinase
MYLAIDIGGTKTLVASLTNEGVIDQKIRFETPESYKDFLQALADTVVNIPTDNFLACGVGMPGRVDRKNGKGIALGNLPWKNIPIQEDIKKIVKCPVVVDNDANLAGLSEAMLVKSKYDRVLYITISTGIGTGIIINQEIDPAFADSEGGHMLLEHNDRLLSWESFASGHAIVDRYGKQAREITSETTWKHIARDLSVGLIDLIAVIQPQIIIIGGSVGHYLEKYKKPLVEALNQYESPLVPIPPIHEAQRPEEAVLFGCYDLAKSIYGKIRS